MDLADGERATFGGLLVSIFLDATPFVLPGGSLLFLATAAVVLMEVFDGDFRRTDFGSVFSALPLLGDRTAFVPAAASRQKAKISRENTERNGSLQDALASCTHVLQRLIAQKRNFSVKRGTKRQK